MRTSIHKINYILIFLFTPFLYGQRPTHSPNPQDNTPIDFTNLFDVIVFIILPIVMFIFYILWRKQVKKNKDNKN
jgi:hypothetical protein